MKTEIETQPVHRIPIKHNKQMPPEMALKEQLDPGLFVVAFREMRFIKAKPNSKPHKA